MATRNLSIMFTDIKGFTARTSSETRQGMAQFLSLHEQLLVPVFRHFKGTIVKTIGDAFLVYFESPTDAVLCGVTIQEVLRQHNADRKEAERLEVRVAINVGDVELLDKDILGEAVNIAARLETIAEAGEVFFTEAVYQTMNRQEAPSAEIGERIFKGIPHPIRVYKVLHDPNSDLAQNLSKTVNLSDTGPIIAGNQHEPSHMKPSFLPKITMGLLILALIGLGVWVITPSKNDQTLVQVRGLLEQKSFGAALIALDPALRAQPMHEEFLVQAEQAGRGYLQKLSAAGQYQQGMTWLKEQLRDKPYLENLRPELAILDTKSTIMALKTEPLYHNQYYPKPLKELLQRYPQNIEVRYSGGQLLEKEWLAVSALWFYEEALQRGKEPGDYIFDYCRQGLTKDNRSYAKLKRAHAILRKFYPKRRLIWARQTMDNGGVQALRNSWQILLEAQAPLTKDPYYQGVHQLLKNVSEFDPALYTLLVQETAPKRRAHILNLHEELISTYPRFINNDNRRDALAKNMTDLKEAWAK